jgi:hypothetical protein
MNSPARHNPAILGAALTLLLASCSSSVVINEGKKEEQNLRCLGRAYIRASQAAGQPPKDVEELRPFLREFGDPDTILTSPVDGQGYVVVWGTPIAQMVRGQPEVLLAYEQTGANGKRLVLNAALLIHAMTEEDFNKAHKGP